MKLRLRDVRSRNGGPLFNQLWQRWMHVVRGQLIAYWPTETEQVKFRTFASDQDFQR